jgi:hypothetical protein
MSEDTYCDLTKWPRLLVVGDPVTKEQAAEIILRTTSYLGTNDREWAKKVSKILGVKLDRIGYPELEPFCAKYNVLDMEYLGNHQIASSWIGGPHGWVNWEGEVGCDTFNLGKWPSFDAVLGEWQVIASAWPFLSLRAQLVPDEGEALEAAVEFVVKGGEVTHHKPEALLKRPRDAQWTCFYAGTGHERGCTAETLEWAMTVLRGLNAKEQEAPDAT